MDGIIVTTLQRGPGVMRLVSTFVEALPGLCREVHDATTREDWTSAGRLAHRLKGTAAGYGFPAIQELAATVERQAAAGDGGGCRDAATELMRVSARVRSAPAS